MIICIGYVLYTCYVTYGHMHRLCTVYMLSNIKPCMALGSYIHDIHVYGIYMYTCYITWLEVAWPQR